MIVSSIASSKQLLFNFFHRYIAQSPGDGDPLEDALLYIRPIHCVLILLLQLIHNLLQLFQLLSRLNAKRNDELEQMPIRKHIDPFLAEEVIYVGDVSAKEVKGMRVIVLHRLGDIYYVDLVLVVEHVVLTEICVDQFALLIQHSHYFYDLEVELTPALYFGYLCVL